MNYMMFVTSLLHTNSGDDVWYALAVIRRSDDVWIVVRGCILDCGCSPVCDCNDHGIVRDVLLVVV